MGVSTLAAASLAGAGAAVGYAAGYFTPRGMPAETDLAAGGMSPEQLKSEGYYLAKGGWKKKKASTVSDEAVAGDVKKGAALFKAKCATCHSCLPGGPTKQGPNLYGIMGKDAAKSAGFKFTKNLAKAEIKWDDASMNSWLQNPKAMVKGTSMAFPGFKKETDRADVIAYLHAITDGTADLKKGHH